MFEIGVENGFDFLSEEYRRLYERSRATAFQHPIWLNGLYARLAPELRAEPVIVTVRRREDGELLMLLPMVRRRRGGLRIIELADFDVSDYVAPIASDDAFCAVAADLLTCERIRAALRPYDLVRIKKLVDDTQPLERLLGAGERTRMDVSAHAVPLYAPFAQWQSDNIFQPYRRELEKKRRKLARKGELTFGCLEDPCAIEATLAMIAARRRERFPEDLLQLPAVFSFYLDVALAQQEQFARLYTLALDGQPIGGVFGVVRRGRFLVLLSGADLGAYKRYSVGALTFEDVARDCIERGETVLDFTVGDESYKQRFGAQPSGMWMISSGATATGKLAVFVADKAPWFRKTSGHGAPQPAEQPVEYAD